MTKRMLVALVGMGLNTKGPDVNAVQSFGRSSRIGLAKLSVCILYTAEVTARPLVIIP